MPDRVNSTEALSIAVYSTLKAQVEAAEKKTQFGQIILSIREPLSCPRVPVAPGLKL